MKLALLFLPLQLLIFAEWGVADDIFSVKETFIVPLNPQKIKMKVYKSDNELPTSRQKRSARTSHSTCKLPKKMDNSELHCKVYNTHITCTQKCMYGYTLRVGTKKQVTCNFDSDTWLPDKYFEDCQPYVDCTVKLKPGGKLKCVTHFMDHGPECYISCRHFEDQKGVKTSKYACDINGNWSPSLPFCAEPKTGIILVPAPPLKY